MFLGFTNLDFFLEVALEAREQNLALGRLEPVNEARYGPLVVFHLPAVK